MGYNEWHVAHQYENDHDTVWYNYAKEHLNKLDTAGKSILEIGCGRGGFTRYLMQHYLSIGKVYACDYAESAIRIGEEKMPSTGKLTWQKEDIMALSFNDETFDIVVSCETVEHVPDPKKAIFELFRVLKPGGYMILTCPNYFNPFGIWCIYRWMIGKAYTEGGQPYVNYVLAPNIMRWINGAGFKIETWKSTEFIIPARVPKHFYTSGTPALLKLFGFRTFYLARKPHKLSR
jgi:ubiquinone/menaquinone biosynthesis C-methylase UbiE